MPANDETVCVMCGKDFEEPGHLNNLGRCPDCQKKFD